MSEDLRTIPSSLPGLDGPTALLDFGSSSEVLDARLQQQAVQDDNIFNQSSRNSVETSGYGAALLFRSGQSPTRGPSTGDASPTCSSNMCVVKTEK